MHAHASSGAVETIEPAPAKINLALHVTGQRADGYHLLETLVTFTDAGDVIRIRDAAEDDFSISGRFASTLANSGDAGSNLVLRARDLLRSKLGDSGALTSPISIHLEKNLPIASGIGGGSADAAAALRGLMRHWRVSASPETLNEIALTLGADVPMCLASAPLIARGIGEDITPIDLSALAMVLINPLKGVSTPEIFRRLASKNNPPLPVSGDAVSSDWISRIAGLRNDLQQPAAALLPQIDESLSLLTQAGASLARMSGSGATCYGIFAARDQAFMARDAIRAQHPEWYVEATMTKTGTVA